MAPPSPSPARITYLDVRVATTSLPGATFGTPYAAPALTASGGTSPYLRRHRPAGRPQPQHHDRRHLGNADPDTTTGVISGTPTQSGSFPISITATDSTNAANGGPFTSPSKTVTLAVAAATITLTTTSLPGATFGTAYTAPALTASGGTSPYTFAATGLPAGLSLNTTTGVISGTPTQSGSFPVSITATDSTTAAIGGPFTSGAKKVPLNITIKQRLRRPSYQRLIRLSLTNP